MENSEQPAFPVTWQDREGATVTEPGLTKREYFAGLALEGLLASDFEFNSVSHCVETAIRHSDELLKQLSADKK